MLPIHGTLDIHSINNSASRESCDVRVYSGCAPGSWQYDTALFQEWSKAEPQHSPRNFQLTHLSHDM